MIHSGKFSCQSRRWKWNGKISVSPSVAFRRELGTWSNPGALLVPNFAQAIVNSSFTTIEIPSDGWICPTVETSPFCVVIRDSGDKMVQLICGALCPFSLSISILEAPLLFTQFPQRNYLSFSDKHCVLPFYRQWFAYPSRVGYLQAVRGCTVLSLHHGIGSLWSLFTYWHRDITICKNAVDNLL